MNKGWNNDQSHNNSKKKIYNKQLLVFRTTCVRLQVFFLVGRHDIGASGKLASARQILVLSINMLWSKRVDTKLMRESTRRG
jgi:hypothetical protein